MTCKKIREAVDVFVPKNWWNVWENMGKSWEHMGKSWETYGRIMGKSWENDETYVDRMDNWWDMSDMFNKKQPPKVPNISLDTWYIWGKHQTSIHPGFPLFGIFLGLATIKKHMSQICAKTQKITKKHKHNHRKKHGVHLKHIDLLTEKHAVQQEQIEHVDVQ